MSENENIIFGRNTVKEAIRSGRDIDALLVSASSQDGSMKELLALARKHGIVVKEVPSKKLDELTVPFGRDGAPANHQGAVAQIPSIKYSELEDAFALAEKRDKPVFLIALDGVTDPHNLGAIVRSAEAFGAHGVLLPERRSAAMTAAACKTACGAEEYIPIIKIKNLSKTLEELKKRGVWAAAADMDGRPARETDLKGALVLVIGAEGEGISRLVKETCDFTVKVELGGSVSSLNASAAAAVLMYEKTRQEA